MKTLTLCVLLGMTFAFAGITDGDVVMPQHDQGTSNILMPRTFDIEQAQIDMKTARKQGNTEKAIELRRLIEAWWQQNHEVPMHNTGHGNYTNPEPIRNSENVRTPLAPPDWGTDVRIDPNDGVRDVRIASLSNGHLYAISIWKDGADDHRLVHRSTNNGETWSLYDDWNAGTDYDLSDIGIFVSSDTLITWYILNQNSSGDMRTWVRVCLPGTSDDPIYWGSPTGGFLDIEYYDLEVISDAAQYPTDAYMYATWVEEYGSGPDSTRAMFAGSDELDASAWETGPILLDYTSGTNIRLHGTNIAYGSVTDRCWILYWLHPYGYPTTYDECVKGIYSDDYGSSWSTAEFLTPFDNATDEYEPSIAGAHTVDNWVFLCTRVDTNFANDRDVIMFYSIDDGASWTEDVWVTNSYENFLPNVWVDNDDNGFFGVLRQDRATEEHVRHKVNYDVNSPAYSNWTGSVDINDNLSANLSAVYGPYITFNEGAMEECIVWNDYQGSQYSIWFDTYSGVGIAEQIEDITGSSQILLAPNPTHVISTLSYTLDREGRVVASLYDATGSLIRNIVDRIEAAGTHHVSVHTGDLASGVYFIKVQTPESQATTVMTVIR